MSSSGNRRYAYDSQQFNHPLIVGIYNSLNPIDEYKDFYINLARAIEAETIVDIGCGTGLLTSELARNGFAVVGIEPSRPMLDIARRTINSPRITWINGAAKDLPESGADLAIMTGHVAQFHLTDDEWRQALIGINTALKVGGYLAFESRNPKVEFWRPGNQAQSSWQRDESNPNVRHDPEFGEVRTWARFLSFESNILRYELHYQFADQDEHVVSTDALIFRSQEEITTFLASHGFEVEAVYGDWDRSPVTDGSPELIILARKL